MGIDTNSNGTKYNFNTPSYRNNSVTNINGNSNGSGNYGSQNSSSVIITRPEIEEVDLFRYDQYNSFEERFQKITLGMTEREIELKEAIEAYEQEIDSQIQTNNELKQNLQEELAEINPEVERANELDEHIKNCETYTFEEMVNFANGGIPHSYWAGDQVALQEEARDFMDLFIEYVKDHPDGSIQLSDGVLCEEDEDTKYKVLSSEITRALYSLNDAQQKELFEEFKKEYYKLYHETVPNTVFASMKDLGEYYDPTIRTQQKELEELISNIDLANQKLEEMKKNSKYNALQTTEDYLNYNIDVEAMMHGLTTKEDYVNEIVDNFDYLIWWKDTESRTPESQSASLQLYEEYEKYIKEHNINIYDLNSLQLTSVKRAFAEEYYEKYKDGIIDNPLFPTVLGVGQELNDLYYYEKKYPEETGEMIKMYFYLLETEGQESADEYLLATKDRITQIKGQEEAQEFLSTLNENEEFLNHLKTLGKGTGDGIESFFEGINSWFEKEHGRSINEYEKMYIMQAFATQEEKIAYGLIDENGNSTSTIIDYSIDYADTLGFTYEVGQSIGNMLPVMALSLIPVVGQPLATTSLAASSGGQAYHQARMDGYSVTRALLYGGINGLTSATLEKFLGSLPGISSNPASSFIGKIVQEGGQELLETLITSGLIDSIVLGKQIDLGELSEEAVKSFIMGMIVSGTMNIGQPIRLMYNNVSYALSSEAQSLLIELINKNIHPVTALKIVLTGIDIETVSNNIGKSDFLDIYEALETTADKESFYIEFVIENSLSNEWNIQEHIAASKYDAEHGDGAFYKLSNNTRDKLIKAVKLKELSKADLEAYKVELADKREEVAQNTIEKLKELESAGALKDGYTAEKVLGLITSDVSPETYLSKDYIDNYKAKWKPDADGNITVYTFQSADPGASNIAMYGKMGIPNEGAFCMNQDQYEAILNDPKLFKDGVCINTALLMDKLGGVKLGTSVIAIKQTININDLILPKGSMIGAYIGDWIPGLYTSGGAVEGVAPTSYYYNDDGTRNENMEIITHSDGIDLNSLEVQIKEEQFKNP